MKVVIYKSKQDGQWRGKVIATNGKILVVTSEGYRRKGDARKALKLASSIIAIELA